MAQGDIYTIDANLTTSSQIVSIINDSIVLNAIVLFSTVSNYGYNKYGEIKLLNSNGEFIHRLFYKYNKDTQDWELIGIPSIKKLKLNAGEQLQFTAYTTDFTSKDTCRLKVRITLMEV